MEAERTPAVHRAIVCVDVAGFGDLRRTNRDQVAMRDGMYRALRRAFARSGLRWARCHREDRGDGALILVPSEVPKELLAVRLPEELASALDAHNRQAGPRARIRLRAAVHAGEVHHDRHGVAGAAINLAFRLLEAGALKQALHRSPGTLALIASEWFYEEVIRHHPASSPKAYVQVPVSVKETRTRGWVRLPGLPGLQHLVGLPGLPGLVPRAGGAGPARGPDDPRVPHQLPAAVRDFVGRDRELALLDSLLATVPPRPSGTAAHTGDGVAIALVTGPAGVGKTALAVHAAHRARHRFPDGQLYVDLRGYAAEPPLSPEQALEGLLHGLGVSPARIPRQPGARSAMYRSMLDGRRMLVVLDNAASAAQVRPLLPGAPGCAVLVTGRGDLSGLAAREGARPVDVAPLAPAESVELLRRIIGAERVDADPGAAERLARHCDRLPLALRVAAERAAARPGLRPADLVRELEERGRLDVLGADDELTAPRTVLSWSYRALPSAAARMFRLLALHPGEEVPRDAATVLAGAGPGEARRLLDRLVRARLLEEAVPGVRYRLAGLLRCYAAELVAAEEPEEDRRAAVRRLLAWYLHTAEEARRQLCPRRLVPRLTVPDGPPPRRLASQKEAREWCGAERANLAAAVRLAPAAGQHDIGWRLPLALWRLSLPCQAGTDWDGALRGALDSARHAGDAAGEAYALAALGFAAQDTDRLEQAAAHFLDALPLFERLRDRRGEAWALHGLGYALRRLRRYEEAVLRHGQALRISTEIGDSAGRAWSLGGLGFALAGQRRYAESVDSFEQALAVARGTDRRAEGWSLYGLGHAYEGLGRSEQATGHYGRALQIFREIGDRRGQGETLDGLGKAHLRAGRRATARSCWNRALEVFDDPGSPRAAKVRERLLLLDGDRAREHSGPEVEAEAAVPSP